MSQGKKPWARLATVALIVSFTAALISVASSASALEFYVDGGTGDDARSALEAQTQATPWATISHALSTVGTAGGRHTIRVQSGTYGENPASAFANVELRALGGPVTITAAGGSPGIDISHADILIEGITIEGGTHGIRAATADGLVIRDSTSVGATSNGFHIETTTGVTIENSRAISAGGRGILLEKSSLAYVRNNLCYENGEWGIDVENTDAPLPPTSTGNVIAFNTVAYNGTAGGGGVRLLNATGEVRDNIITDNTGIGLRIDTAGANVQNTLLFGNTKRLSPSSYALGGGMLAVSPMYVDPDGADGTRGGIANYADDVFALDPSSAAVDAGSGLVGGRDIDGSTRQDLAPDSGTADLGFHQGAGASAGPPAVPVGPATYYVNAGTGSDANDRIAAQDPSTPWATISHALASGLIDGETIVVSAGTYAESLATTANDTTIITTAGATLEIPFDDTGITVSHGGTTIDGFTIDGATNGAKHGIQITSANGTTIQDVIVDTPTEVGVKASTSSNLLFQDVTVTAPGTRGVELTTCATATVRGLVVTGGQHAVHATSATGLTVEGATVSNQTKHGIQITSANGTTIQDVIVDTPTEVGVKASTSSNLLFQDVTVTAPGTRGVELTTCATATVRGLVVTGGQHAVHATSATGLTVEGATVSNQTKHGIQITSANGTTIQDVIVDTPTEVGVKASTSSNLLFQDVTVTAPGTRGVELTTCATATVRGLVVTGGQHAVHATSANGLTIEGATVSNQTNDAFSIATSTGVVLDTNAIDGSGSRAIYLDRVDQVYARNNEVIGSDDWGIHFDASAGSTSENNIIAFNTVVANGAGQASSGGVRLQNASGEIRDNIVVNNTGRGIKTDTAGSTVHHNDVFGSATDYESLNGSEPIIWANLAVDPAFVGGSDYRLTAGSPVIDNASGDVSTVDISGSATQSGVADSGTADLGFHPDASVSTGAPAPAPALPGAGTVHYVDCATGSNANTKSQAQSPGTPWLTIRYAVNQLGFGEVVEVANGTCNETDEVEIGQAGIVVRAASDLGTIVAPPTNTTAFNVQASQVTVQGFAIQTDLRAVLVAPPDATDLTDVTVRGLLITPTPTLSSDGITVRDTVRATVENSVISGGIRGIHLRRTQDSYVRNNRVANATDWGIQVDDISGVGDASGNIVAFNTVTGNGDTPGDGGIRFLGATGEARDNIVASNTSIGIKTDTAPVHVHHNDVFGNATAFDSLSGQEPALWGNIAADPLFVGGDQRLSEIFGGGQATNSPAMDMGSGTVAASDISGTTRTDDAADTDVANMGYHHNAGVSGGIPAVQAPPGGQGPYTYYVNAATGDDSRSPYDARDPSSPWLTIGKALSAGAAAATDTVSVKAGTYAESLSSTTGMVSLIADGVVQITPAGGQTGLQIDHPGFLVDGFTITGGQHGLRATSADGLIVRNCQLSGQSNNAIMIVDTTGATVDGFTITGGQHGLRATSADGLIVRNCQLSGQSNNGIMVVDTTGATIENNRVDTASQRGIFLDDTDQAYVRNNGVTNSGEWGIHFDANGGPVSAGNVVAFNTVYGSGASAGGIRFQNATGEIRDNIATMNTNIAIKVDTAPTYIHHNILHSSSTDIDTQNGQEPVDWDNATTDPLLVNPAGGDLSLSHLASGQGADSPAIDQGSAVVVDADISGSTRTDATADSGMADPGFHASASPSTGIPAVMTGPVPPPKTPKTYYVDPTSGNNGNSATDAQSPGSAWQTIDHAIGQSVSGDTLHLQAGTYAEQVNVDVAGLTLEGVGALGTVILTPPGGQVGITVDGFSDVRIENLVVEGGTQGIRAENANGLRIVGVATTNQDFIGIHVVGTADAWVDSCIVTGSGSRGMSLERSSALYVRNNLVYANTEWGIDVDNTSAPLSTGNAIAFNTVYQNGDGIRVRNVSAEIRDNQITGQVDLGLFLSGTFLSAHHNNFANNARDRDRDSSSLFVSVWDNLGKNPRYVNAPGPDGLLGGANWADDDFRLQTLAAGEDYDSPSIDGGSNDVSTLDIGGSTATLGAPDSSTADVGYHYGAPAGVAIPAYMPPPPEPNETYYTSPSIGDDTRTKAQAQNPATPWETLGTALQQASDGDTVIALAGTYVESASVERADLTLVSDTPGGAVIQPITGAALAVSSPGVTIDGFVLKEGTTGITVTVGGDDVRITNCSAAGSATDGFRATDVSGLTIENSIASGSLFSGIQLRRVQSATVRNTLSYANGEWGLSHDNSPGTGPLSVDNLVAHNTFTMNGVGNARLLNAVGLVRDNLLTDSPGTGLRIDTAGAVLSHNGFNANTVPLDPESYLFCVGCMSNETIVPDYIDPTGTDGILGGTDWTDDDFRLMQVAAGQASESDAVGFGSDLASTLAVNGSTATSGAIDSGTVDLGYHYDSSSTALPSPGYSALPLDVLYVDVNTGDDGRSRSEANVPGTPWQTLEHALSQVVPGDTLLVEPGTYPEALQVGVQNVKIRGTDASPTTTILAPAGRDGIRIRATGVEIENLSIQDARRGIVTLGRSDDLLVEDVIVNDAERYGLALGNADGISLSGVIVARSGRYGVYVRKATGFEMRDCDLYGNGRSGLRAVRTDGTITFVTAYGNRNGVRGARNTLTVRDSIFAGNTQYGFRARSTDTTTMSHTLLGLNGRGDLYPTALGAGTGMQLATDPLLVDPDNGDLSLQLASPAIDAGSDSVGNLGVTGSATGGAPDTGIADLGAHQ